MIRTAERWMGDQLAHHTKRLSEPCPCHGHDPVGDAWHERKGPAPALRARHDLPTGCLPHWVDHQYRLRDDHGGWKYVCEPYWVTEDCIEDLGFLIKQGWKVTVSSTRARHFPGHTVAIEIGTSYDRE